MGGFQGVASTSTDKSLRLFNGRTRYDEWVFAPGQPRIIGKPIGLPTGSPGARDRSGSGMRQALRPAGTGTARCRAGRVVGQPQPYVVPP